MLASKGLAEEADAGAARLEAALSEASENGRYPVSYTHLDVYKRQALSVSLGPGIIGSEVNRRLAPFGRKIGPDPASIATCKIGGIAANNASGMCCGTAQNSYQTLVGLRVMLADGSVLDTEDAVSLTAFQQSHAELLGELERLGNETRADDLLAARIRQKFKKMCIRDRCWAATLMTKCRA